MGVTSGEPDHGEASGVVGVGVSTGASEHALSAPFVDALVARNVDTCNTSHSVSPLSLALLMIRINTDHAHHAISLDDLAFRTTPFDR